MSDKAKGKIVVDMAGAMEKLTPEMLRAMSPILTNPMIAALESRVNTIAVERDTLRARAEAAEAEVVRLREAVDRMNFTVALAHHLEHGDGSSVVLIDEMLSTQRAALAAIKASDK